MKQDTTTSQELKNYIANTILLIKENKNTQARDFFNKYVFPKYLKNNLINSEKFKSFKIFLFELDDYFSNTSLKNFKNYSDKEYKDYIVDMYENDF